MGIGPPQICQKTLVTEGPPETAAEYCTVPPRLTVAVAPRPAPGEVTAIVIGVAPPPQAARNAASSVTALIHHNLILIPPHLTPDRCRPIGPRRYSSRIAGRSPSKRPAYRESESMRRLNQRGWKSLHLRLQERVHLRHDLRLIDKRWK